MLPRIEGAEKIITVDWRIDKTKNEVDAKRSLATVTCLQGLINRAESERIYLHHPPIRLFDTVEEFGDASQFFLDAGLIPFPREAAVLDTTEKYPTLAWLLDRYGDRLVGYVRAPGYSNAEAGGRAAAVNEVTFGSGVESDWLCYAPDEIYNWMVARGYDLPVVADTRDMTILEAFDWSFARHINHAKRSRDLIGYGETGATPPIGNDYFVAAYAFIHALEVEHKHDPDPEVDPRLEQLLDTNVYPLQTPHIGPVEGGKIIQKIQNLGSLAFVSQTPNVSVTSSIPRDAIMPRRLEPRPRAPQTADGVYLCFNGPDGDAIDFMPWIAAINIKEDPAFGEVPLTFRLTPAFVDLFPTLVAWASRLGNGIELMVTYNDGGPPPPGMDEARAIYGASIKRVVELSNGAYRHLGSFGSFPGSGRNAFNLVGHDDFLSIITGYDNQADGLMCLEVHDDVVHMCMIGQSRYPGLTEEEYQAETASRIATQVENAAAGEPVFLMVRAPEPRGFRTLSRCKEVVELVKADPRIGARQVFPVPASELAALWRTWNDGQWQAGTEPPEGPTPSEQPTHKAEDLRDFFGVNGGVDTEAEARAVDEIGLRWVRTSLKNEEERARMQALYDKRGVKACALTTFIDWAGTAGDLDWVEVNGQRVQAEAATVTNGQFTNAGTYVTDTSKGSYIGWEQIDFGAGTTSATMRVRVPAEFAYGWMQLWRDGARRAQDGVKIGTTGSLESTNGSWQTLTVEFDPPVTGVHDLFCLFHPRKSLQPDDIRPWLDELAADCGEAVGAIEGMNEYDNSHPDWANEVRSFQQRLYDEVKNHPSALINTLPVIAPSLVGPDSHIELGDVTDRSDFGNMHPYTGGLHPEHKHLEKMEVVEPTVGAGPIWVTEFGWHHALGYRPDGNWFWTPITDRVSMGYTPRGYLTHFMRRYPNLPWVEKAFIFKLTDNDDPTGNQQPSDHFGLVRFDGTLKPAAVTLRNLIALLGTGETQQSPAALSFTVEDLPADGEVLAVRRADGSALIFLWRAAEEFDKRGYIDGKTVEEAEQLASALNVRVKLANVAKKLRVYRPHLSIVPQKTADERDNMEISVDGKVTILELFFTEDNAAPAKPQGLNAVVR